MVSHIEGSSKESRELQILAGQFAITEDTSTAIVIKPEFIYPDAEAVLVVEGFAKETLKYIGAAFYNQKSNFLFTQMASKLKGSCDSLRTRIIIPSDTIERYTELFSQIKMELEDSKMNYKDYPISGTSPDKIVITWGSNYSKIYQSNIL